MNPRVSPSGFTTLFSASRTVTKAASEGNNVVCGVKVRNGDFGDSEDVLLGFLVPLIEDGKGSVNC